MLLWLLVVAVSNMALGLCFALWGELARRPAARPAPPPQPLPPEEPAPPEPDDEVGTLEELLEQPEPCQVEEVIPDEWISLLETEDLAANSLVEASIEVLRLQVCRYRERLILLESALRLQLAGPQADDLLAAQEQLAAVNQEWLAQQGAASEQLGARRGKLGKHETTADHLERALLDQAAQIETTQYNMQMIDARSDAAACCRRMITECCRLIDLAHTLRDRMQESMLEILREEERLDGVSRRYQYDSLTGLHNRTGLDCVCRQWWRDDPRRSRTVSLAMIDIDQFGRVNERLGTRAGDRLLQSFGSLIADLVRRDRGFDVACRLEGQRFVFFLADTGPRNATSTVERIRQTIAATEFAFGSRMLQITVSAAVAEIQAHEEPHEVVARCAAALREAKNAGRNCTWLDEGNGPAATKPPRYQVRSRSVQVLG